MTAVAFELPAALEAGEPPEARGLARDEVRLLVARRSDGAVEHAGFRDLPGLLSPGDLLVINVSGTLPAALPARRADGSPLRVHFATRAPRLSERWRLVELRSEDGARPLHGASGEDITLAGGAKLTLAAPYVSGARLLLAHFEGRGGVQEYLMLHGEPIRYSYVPGDWPLSAYQTIYATAPGSAEMPSAGRPFTAELITRLVSRGVLIAPITLHTGVSSPERHEPPFPEYFEVPEPTAQLVRSVRASGGLVVAVGTTVVRALETVAGPGDEMGSGSGWTSLVIEPERRLLAVDALITGWHEPAASHLKMLEALAGKGLLARSYRAALQCRYLWHEFGDSHLILP